MKQLFLTRSRINANQPLQADDAILTVEQLRKKVRNAEGLPVKDGYQLEAKNNDWNAVNVGTVLKSHVTDSGELWLLYEVDPDLLNIESQKDMMTGKAGAFAAFEYDPEHSYQDMIYASIWSREPDRFPWEGDNSTHKILCAEPADITDLFK